MYSNLLEHAKKTFVLLFVAIFALGALFLFASPVFAINPPTGLNVTAGASPNINLTWTAPGGQDHYKVYRALSTITDANKSAAKLLSNNVTTESYTDSTGIPGERYYYQVTAVDAFGSESGVSTSVTNDNAIVAGSENPHYNYSNLTNFCRDCHQVHLAESNVNVYRRTPSIDICYVCHDGTGSTYNIQNTYKNLAAHDTQLTNPASDIKCIYCHYPHDAPNPTRYTWLTKKSEENLCYTDGCHDNAAHNRTTTILSWNIYNQFQLTSRHAITGTTGDGLTGAKIECSSCHGPHTVKYSATTLEKISDPDNTYKLANATGTGISILTDFCLKCHDGTPPTQTWGSSTTFVPYTITFPTVSSYPFFPGWNKSAYTSSSHNASYTCKTCHHPHGSQNKRLLGYNYDTATTYAEEGLCLVCHDGSPATTNVDAALNKLYKHPVKTYSGRHSDTETASGLAEANKHSECVDCHNPHNATSSNEIQGVGGVQKDGATPINPASYQYEICFKCHSNYNGGFTGYTNKADEFNGATRNAWHPVANTGKNLGIRDGAFVQGTPWNSTAGDDADYSASSEKISCSGSRNTSGTFETYGCHGNDSYSLSSDAQGPHGSGIINILIANGDTSSGSASSSDICFFCHNWDTYYNDGYGRGATATNTRFEHAYHIQQGYNCTEACHQNVAHGTDYYHFMRSGYTHYSDGGYLDTTTAGCSATGGCHSGSDIDYPRYYSNY